MRPVGVPDSDMIFFRLTSWELGLLFFVVILGATGLGVFLGHRVRHLSDSLKEPFGVLQAALLGLVALLLAFGLSLAVSRYEDSPLEHRHRGQRDRHDIPPRPDPAGAGPQPFARPARRATRGAPCGSRTRCRAATGPRPPAHRRSGSSAGSGASPESALDTAPIGERAAPLRRDPQRDVRRGDRRASRPSATGSRPPSWRSRCSAPLSRSGCSPPTWRSSGGACSRSCSRRRSWPSCSS